jgi:hypothetical protein
MRGFPSRLLWGECLRWATGGVASRAAAISLSCPSKSITGTGPGYKGVHFA